MIFHHLLYEWPDLLDVVVCFHPLEEFLNDQFKAGEGVDNYDVDEQHGRGTEKDLDWWKQEKVQSKNGIWYLQFCHRQCDWGEHDEEDLQDAGGGEGHVDDGDDGDAVAGGGHDDGPRDEQGQVPDALPDVTDLV